MSTFRIAMDAHWLVCHPNCGISTYLRGLLSGWLQAREDVHVDLLVPFRPPTDSEALFNHSQFQLVYPRQPLNPIASYRAQLRWQQVDIPRLVRPLKPDVYLSPFHLTSLWLPGIKTVTTIHDLCFMAEPRFSQGRLLHTAQLWSACLKASRLICISHATRRALAEWSPTFAQKATVVHNGFEGHTLPRAEAIEYLRRLDATLMPQQYLLWVGIPCPRKDLPLLLEIFQAHYQKFSTHKFVIVTPTKYQAEIKTLVTSAQAEMATALRFYSVDNANRDALYRCALAFIFPSSCEGFGYPALEALVQGCPTLALANTSMHELIADVIPLAAAPTSAAFTEILSPYMTLGETERETLQKKLIARAGIFSSPIMATKTLDLLRQTITSERD